MNSLQGWLLGAATILLLSFRPTQAPPLWWDEGWALTIARNWVESGSYGPLRSGQLASANILTLGLPGVAPIALSFRLLGVGAWQGRLPGALFTIGALALAYFLASRLYNRSVAVATLVVLLLATPNVDLHPILLGRQTLGELPAMFYLLAGFAAWLAAQRRQSGRIVLPVVFWGLALWTKPQVLPFLVISLSLPLVITLLQRRWSMARMLAAELFGSLAAWQLFLWLQGIILGQRMLPSPQIPGLYGITAFVPVLTVRVTAVLITLALGLPAWLGLGYVGLNLIHRRIWARLDTELEVVRLTLWGLAASWLAWYLLLSAGWIRYLFPPVFLSSVFFAALLHDWTEGFALTITLDRAREALIHRSRDVLTQKALGAMLLALVMIPTTVLMLYQAYIHNADASVYQTAEFLNTQTPPDALIETYDSELFFLLERRYHYPPDDIQVPLNRRAFQGQSVLIDYDPLPADPDYLVVGPHSRLWHLYDGALATGEFRLLWTYRRYEIYARVR